ncbi:MAG: LysR family transcriptional regulator [Pseudomonadota bacterium]
MDRFNELRAFNAVIDAGGFSAAARQTGQSRSAVNRLVIALEERLGTQLLHRTTRTVAANSTGRAFYDKARQILDDLDELERSVAAARSEPSGLLRVSVPFSLGDLDFAALVTAFMQRHPSVGVEIAVEGRLVDPVAEGFDVVIRIAEPDEQTTLVDHRILTLDYLLCAAPSYLAVHGVPPGPEALREHATLFHRHGAGPAAWLLKGVGETRSVPLQPVMTANSLEPLLTAARAGVGIAMMPAYTVRSCLAAGRLCDILPAWRPPTRMMQVIYPPARHLSAKVRVFTDFVTHWCTGD